MSHSDPKGAVIVTGGSRGIGAATVRRLALAGYPVLFTYHSNAAAADTLCADLHAQDAQVVALQSDAADPAAAEAVVTECIRRFGAPIALFANAGITGPALPLRDLDMADLRRVIDTNLLGVFAIAKAATAAMPQGGSVVLMSSRAAKLGGAGEWVHYAASKGAIDTMTVGLARELGPAGIRVNAVAPGLIDTEIHAAAGVGDRLVTMKKNVPMQRIGRADEVAKVVSWLLSDDASYVTGTVVDVSGGR